METLQQAVETLHGCVESFLAIKSDTPEGDVRTVKDTLKESLFAVLTLVSETPKEELSTSQRAEIDASLCGQDSIRKSLKWPLVRALENPHHYRALLGLPQTLEQTRRFLTTVPSKKVTEIMENLQGRSTDISDIQQLDWMQSVLRYVLGEGKRKKELEGFVLQPSSSVRGVLNKIQQKQKDLKQSAAAAQKGASKTKPVVYEMEKDVRVTDQERRDVAKGGMSRLVDDALKKSQT